MADSDISNIDPTNKNNDVEIAKIFYEFKYKTVMESATKLTQFALIFFSVSTFITTITAFTNFDIKTKAIVFYSMCIMVIVFTIIGASIMYGVIAGLNQIRETLKIISLETYNKLNMDKYFKRGIRVLITISIVSIIGIAAIITSVFVVT